MLKTVVLLHIFMENVIHYYLGLYGFPVAQMVEHGASNAKIMGSIPRESKSWSNVKKKNCNSNAM